MAFRKACAESIKAASVPTHALVQFYADNTVSIIGVKKLEAKEMTPGSECMVRWSKAKKYTGLLLAVGKYYSLRVLHVALMLE